MFMSQTGTIICIHILLFTYYVLYIKLFQEAPIPFARFNRHPSLNFVFIRSIICDVSWTYLKTEMNITEMNEQFFHFFQQGDFVVNYGSKLRWWPCVPLREVWSRWIWKESSCKFPWWLSWLLYSRWINFWIFIFSKAHTHTQKLDLPHLRFV